MSRGHDPERDLEFDLASSRLHVEYCIPHQNFNKWLEVYHMQGFIGKSISIVGWYVIMYSP